MQLVWVERGSLRPHDIPMGTKRFPPPLSALSENWSEGVRRETNNATVMEGIVRTDDVLGGEPRLAGRRISVRQISELAIDGGIQPAEIADQLQISQADVHRALTYYYENPEEMRTVRMRHREAFETLQEEALSPPETLRR